MLTRYETLDLAADAHLARANLAAAIQRLQQRDADAVVLILLRQVLADLDEHLPALKRCQDEDSHHMKAAP